MAQIEADRQNPPPYDLNDNNCADYVLDLLAGIGIQIVSQEGSWILGEARTREILAKTSWSRVVSQTRIRWSAVGAASPSSGSSAGQVATLAMVSPLAGRILGRNSWSRRGDEAQAAPNICNEGLQEVQKRVLRPQASCRWTVPLPRTASAMPFVASF